MDELDQEIDLDQITDVNLLQSLLDQTDDPEDRKVIRDRIKELTAAKKAEQDAKLSKINNQQHERLQEKKKQAEEHKQRTADMYQKMSSSAPAGAPKQLDTNVLRKDPKPTSPTPRAAPVSPSIAPSKPLSGGNLPLTIAPKDAVEDSIKRRQREAEERKRRILAAYDVASKSGGSGPKDVDLDVANKIDLEAYERQKGQTSGATFQMAGGIPVMNKGSSVPSTPIISQQPAFQPELDAMERALRERQQYCEEQKRKALESYRKVAAGPAGPKVWATNV